MPMTAEPTLSDPARATPRNRSTTLDAVARLFPDRSLAVFRVRRGPEPDRSLVWVAQWDGGYFTSDSDRHVYHGGSNQHFGDTPGEALYRLVASELDGAKATVASYEQHLQEAQQALASAEALLGETLTGGAP